MRVEKTNGSLKPMPSDGPQIIQISIERMEEYYGALQQCMHMTFPGNVSYAISRNWKFATDLFQQMRKERFDLLKKYAELDKDGNIKVQEIKEGESVQPNGPQPTFKTAEGRLEFARYDDDLVRVRMFDMRVHLVRMSTFKNMATPIKPGLIIVLEPMIFNDLPDDVPTQSADVLSEQEPKQSTDSVQPAAPGSPVEFQRDTVLPAPDN